MNLSELRKMDGPRHSAPRPVHFCVVALLTLWAGSLACATLGGPPAGPTLPAPVQWRRDIATDAISPPALADGLLIYKDSVTAIVGRRATDGAEKWRYAIHDSPSLFRPLAVAGGRVFVDESPVDSANQAHPRLVALDTQTGQVAWQAALTSSQKPNLFYQPVAAEGVVYYESLPDTGERVLNAADASTGALRWQFPLTGTRLQGDPAVDGGQVFVAVLHSSTVSAARNVDDLVALDAATGVTRWRVTLTGWAEPSLAVGNGRLYATVRDGNVVALDTATGAVVWKFAFSDIHPTSPLLAGDSVYFGDTFGNLYALDAASGALRWQTKLGSRIPSRVAVSGGRVYAGTVDGLLFALDTATGNPLWQTPNPLNKSWPTPYVPPLETEPVAVAGVLYYFNGTELVALDVP